MRTGIDSRRHRPWSLRTQLPEELARSLPSMITGVRLGFIPVLVLLLEAGLSSFGALLFVGLLVTDVLDGYMARRLESSSSFGAYFDASTDLVLILGVFSVFDSKGFLPDWVMAMILLYFAQFLITSLHWGRVYDPVGKHYGTLLYGAIALRFLLSGPFFDEVVTVTITGFTAVSFFARMSYLRSAGRGDERS